MQQLLLLFSGPSLCRCIVVSRPTLTTSLCVCPHLWG